MQADKHRLRRQWATLNQKASPDADGLAKWEAALKRSVDRRSIRLASIPACAYDEDLPITHHKEEIIQLLRERQVVVVCGETGSGKSTQLPKYCLEAGLGATGIVGHTQPRRLAARAIASRLADELSTQVGDLVGFKIRFTDTTKPQTLVKLMTDGVMLAETQSDRFLDNYDAIIIDEAHERSLNIDFLLAYLRKIQSRRPDLRILITSATIDPERFARHFQDQQGDAPIVEVSGRTYPVEIRYRAVNEDAESSLAADDMTNKAIAAAADELLAEGQGDILTFLPTERDIRSATKYLRGHFGSQHHQGPVELLPLYARLSHAEQNKVFAKHSKQRIVLATNVAESSLTVPGIRYVIDTGLARISRYAPRSRVRRLPIEPVSQASANQRSGRCGRLGPGVCIRLFSEDDFAGRAPFTTPEIQRSDLASVILQSHMLRLGNIEELPLLESPKPESIRDGRKTLQELGALDDHLRLTEIGRKLGRLPCDPRVGRILIEADSRGCLAETVIIAAAIECQDVRQRPAGKTNLADAAHADFLDPSSDFLAYLRLWQFFEGLREQLGRSRLQRALQTKFLSYQAFREWADTVRQLRELLSEAGMRSGALTRKLPPIDAATTQSVESEIRGRPKIKSKGGSSDPPKAKSKRHKQRKTAKRSAGFTDNYVAIHQSLLSGLLSGIAMKTERHSYQAAGNINIDLWPGSGLFERAPRWIVSSEIVETSRRYGRTLAEVDPEWIEALGKDLLKHSYSDPHWSSKTGTAMVYQRSSLFGIPVVAGRRVPLAPIDPESARQLMIEHGLVEGEWKCGERFYLHNQEILKDVDELVRRTRKTHYVVDRYHQISFYQQRLPSEIVDIHSLRKWCKQNHDSAAHRALFMQLEDLIETTETDFDLEHQFPNELRMGDTKLPLHYNFEPGSQADGVSLYVPQAALRQLSDDALGWLVPGLLQERVIALIRSLPKSKRTNFVPAPQAAQRLVAELEDCPRNKPFISELCRLMTAYAGEPISPADLNSEKVPDHLRFLIHVLDDDGMEVGQGRSIEALQRDFAEAMDVGETRATNDDWVNQEITPQTFQGFDQQVLIMRGGVQVAAFPTLVDLEDRVELQLASTQESAERKTAQGLVRLFASQHGRSLRNQVVHIPQLESCGLQLAHIFQSTTLREELPLLIARIAFVERRAMIRDREPFEARNAEAVRAISIATQEVATWLPKLGQAVHGLRLQLEAAPQSWQTVTDDIQRQLADLCHDKFLRSTPWVALQELPRYVEAKKVRLEKLSNGGVAKDQRLNDPIALIENDWRESPAQSNEQYQAQLDEIKWMIEEWRVSIFAQQLGTRMKVSEKRIRKQLDALL